MRLKEAFRLLDIDVLASSLEIEESYISKLEQFNVNKIIIPDAKLINYYNMRSSQMTIAMNLIYSFLSGSFEAQYLEDLIIIFQRSLLDRVSDCFDECPQIVVIIRILMEEYKALMAKAQSKEELVRLLEEYSEKIGRVKETVFLASGARA